MEPDISLSSEEFDALLFREAVVVLGSINADGTPHLAPVWPIHVAGALYVETGARSMKARNLLRSAAFALSAGSGPWGPSALLSGSAREVSDAAVRAQVRGAMIKRYYGSSSNPGYAMMEAEYERSGGSIVFELLEEARNSWDYRKLPPERSFLPRA
jgi:general stress protein 26